MGRRLFTPPKGRLIGHGRTLPTVGTSAPIWLPATKGPWRDVLSSTSETAIVARTPVIIFGTAASPRIGTSFAVPDDWSAFYVKLVLAPNVAETGVSSVWDVFLNPRADGEAFDAGDVTLASNLEVVSPTVQYERKTVTVASSVSHTAGDIYTLRVGRDHDEVADDADVMLFVGALVGKA